MKTVELSLKQDYHLTAPRGMHSLSFILQACIWKKMKLS